MSTIEKAKKEIVEAVRILHKGKVLSRSDHGNISMKIEGTNLIAISRRSYLYSDFSEQDIEIVEFDNEESLKKLHPSTYDIVNMHKIIYDVRPDINAVIHTHSPNATSFAIASRPIPFSYEAMISYGIFEAIPVAKWGRRGTPQSIRNIQSVITEKTNAVLLEHHGLLVFAGNAIDAAWLVLTVEESAELIRQAEQLGEVNEIPYRKE